jgi:hypothetical protein
MIRWSRIPLRAFTLWFAASFATFGLCCYLLYAWHAEISGSVVATYALLGAAGVSALTWPIFAVKLTAALASRLLRRPSSLTRNISERPSGP